MDSGRILAIAFDKDEGSGLFAQTGGLSKEPPVDERNREIGLRLSLDRDLLLDHVVAGSQSSDPEVDKPGLLEES